MDKARRASTNPKPSEIGRCCSSKLVRKCTRKQLQNTKSGEPAINSEDDIRSRLGAYGLEMFHRKVAAAVNVPRKQKVYKGLTSLEFDKSELLKQEEQRGVGVKRRQVKKDNVVPGPSSLDKLSATLLAPADESTNPQERLAPGNEFPEQTFTLENAPTCRAFCISEGLREPRGAGGRKRFPQKKVDLYFSNRL